MSVTTTAELDLLIQKATSESIPNGELDLPSALEVSDVVRSRRVPPKECMRCLKKRIMTTSSNPNTQLSSWKLTDICVKNGGIPFIKEICSREFMDTMEHAILKSQNNNELEELVTRLFYELYVTFKNDSQLNYVARVYEKLLARGVQFPQLNLDPSNSMAMFDSRTPADWVDSDACMICSKKFSLINRRHHCRSCGGIFCQEHSSHRIVLSDLGIYEPVRVCDNCYEDYDLKKSSGSGKKKHHGKRKKKAGDVDYDEDDQLRKAIELSLRESKGNIEPIVPVMPSKAEIEVKTAVAEEEEDPELKAAIEASLKLAEEEKRRREAYSGSSQKTQTQQRVSIAENAPAPPSFDLTSNEEEDIHLFASLVERMKTQSATEILEDNQLAQLYQKVLGTRPKLNNALNESVQKYNTLIDMNTKISDIMTIYDSLLERQLNSINLSDCYSIPQGPSDPYSYYQENPSGYRQREPPNYQQQQAPQQVASRQQQVPPQQQQVPPQQQQVSPQQQPVAFQQQQVSPQQQPVSYQQQQMASQQQPVAFQQHQVPPPQQQAASTQQQVQSPVNQQPEASVSESHINQMKDINLSPNTQLNALHLPSEPPYPAAEDDEGIAEDNRSSRSHEVNRDNNTLTRTTSSNRTRKLSNAPYPMEDEEPEPVSQPENSITNYDFPSVPARKIAQPEPTPNVQENAPEASQAEEKLLIEL